MKNEKNAKEKGGKGIRNGIIEAARVTFVQKGTK
jgi:hypothetical protein